MGIDPDFRNQHTTLDATRAKNRQVVCSCGARYTPKSGHKRDGCAPCRAAIAEEQQRARVRRAHAKKREAQRQFEERSDDAVPHAQELA